MRCKSLNCSYGKEQFIFFHFLSYAAFCRSRATREKILNSNYPEISLSMIFTGFPCGVSRKNPIFKYFSFENGIYIENN